MRADLPIAAYRAAQEKELSFEQTKQPAAETIVSMFLVLDDWRRFAPGRGAAGQAPILEPVSGQVGLRFLGNVIFGGRDRTAITSVEAPCEKSRDQVDPAEGANTGYLA
jgi:hypothetical protein